MSAEAVRAEGSMAFDDMLSPVLDGAFRLAMVMLNNRQAAEDATQEAALKAWRHINRFRAGSDFKPWFLAIVANECRSSRRSPWRRVLALDLFAARPAAAPDLDGRLDLRAALERLPQKHLLPLTLYYHLDLPIADVARVLGCSPNATKVRIHRALKALHPLLAQEVTP